MKIEVYDNGNVESSRIYFGAVPRIIKEDRNWRLVHSTEIETDNSPRKMGEDFRDYLETFTEIKPTYYADLCVFNPATIAEGRNKRVYDLPAGADRVVKVPTGIEHVMVNGRFIRRSGSSITGTGSGRVLRP